MIAAATSEFPMSEMIKSISVCFYYSFNPSKDATVPLWEIIQANNLTGAEKVNKL